MDRSGVIRLPHSPGLFRVQPGAQQRGEGSTAAPRRTCGRRRGRVVADARGRGVFQLRAKADGAELDSLNVRETGARPRRPTNCRVAGRDCRVTGACPRCCENRRAPGRGCFLRVQPGNCDRS